MIDKETRRKQIQQDIDDGRYTVEGRWLIYSSPTCTCGTKDGNHDMRCRIVPVFDAIEAVLRREGYAN